MHRTLACAAVAALFTTITITSARAAESLGDRRDRWPTEVTKRPLTLGTGMLELWVPVNLNASKDADWKPVTSNPSIAFGVTDEWTIGLRHLVGLCFGGASNGCTNVYNDVGAFTRISLMRGAGLDVAVQGGVDATRWSEPRMWAANAGLILRAGGGALALTAAPSVSFGLKDRDTTPSRTTAFGWNVGSYDITTPETTFGNKEWLSVPVTFGLQLGPALAVEVGASLEGPVNPPSGTSFSDVYRIPAGAALIVTPFKYLDVGAALTFPEFAGKNDTRDSRVLALFLALRT